MVFREVSVMEIREVLRSWLADTGLRPAAAQAGVDRKTARRYVEDGRGSVAGLALVGPEPRRTRADWLGSGHDLQLQAWHWAKARQAADGSLPSGKQIASQFGRHERRERLVKRAGLAGKFSASKVPDDGSAEVEEAPTVVAT